MTALQLYLLNGTVPKIKGNVRIVIKYSARREVRIPTRNVVSLNSLIALLKTNFYGPGLLTSF